MRFSSQVSRRAAALASAILVAGVATGLPPTSAAADPTVVTLPSGAQLQGLDTGVGLEWRGIPYAAAPVGELRWRSPQPAPAWVGARDATEFGAHCLQLGENGTVGSEDCLYLNVFAPVDGAPGTPVMVHLHPGSNAFGFGYENADTLIRQDVIVVTLNYRLGAFGFVGHPALTAEGSPPEQGLLDQIAALQWVRDNIAAFGGNPGNVTLFGMSAGSFDALALAASPLAAGLFHRVALETAAFWPATGLFNTVDDADQHGLELWQVFGCDDTTDVPACLRGVPATDIVLATGFVGIDTVVGGSVLPRAPLETIEAQGSVPMLIGSNREEASWVLFPYEDPFRDGLHTRFVTDVVGPSNTAAAMKLYPKADYDSLLLNAVTIFSDAIYTCPTRRVALASASHVTTYQYLYTHVMANDPGMAQFFAGHAFEDMFLWGFFPGYVPTPEEEHLAFLMSTYWTNYAKTGDPNSPGLPLWPRYDAGSEQILVLDDDIATTSAYHAAQCGLMDKLTTPFPTCNSLCRFFETARWWHSIRE